MQCVALNLWSMFWVVGANHYPMAWWKPPLKRFLARYSLVDMVPEANLSRWCNKG